MNKIVNYLANEVIVKSLANNPHFQRFTVKTVDGFKKVTEVGASKAAEAAKAARRVPPPSAAEQPKPEGKSFFAHLRDEIMNDLQGKGPAQGGGGGRR